MSLKNAILAQHLRQERLMTKEKSVVELESPRELSRRTGWPERRIRNLIAQRQLRHVRIGAQIFVPAGAVEEFIDNNMVEPEASNDQR